MSDQALAWKAGFGALVLVLCAGTYVLRKHHETPPPRTTAVSATAAALAAAVPSAEPAPLDVQDDSPPVRIEVALHDKEPAPVPRAHAAAKRRAPAQKMRAAKWPTPRVHPVAAKRKASPYAIGRKHYPYDPRERWALREAP
jgi:hypothetical protein